MIQLAYFQTNPQMGEKNKNLESVKNAVLNYSGQFDIMVLPELFHTGYGFSSQKELNQLAETPDGEAYQLLKELAKKRNSYFFAGFAEKQKEGIYNSSMLVAPDGKQWIYRKTHLFSEEKNFFIKSNSVLEPIEISIKEQKIKVGLMICFDWFFPETARTLSLKGAQILLHAANLVMPHCPAATITRALENRVFIVLCDRVGKDTLKDGREIPFTGLSRIVSPKGEILSSSNETDEEIKVASINPEEALNKKINPLNDLFEDRRTDLYQL